MATSILVNREKSLTAVQSPRMISPTDLSSFAFEFADVDLIANNASLATRLVNMANGEDVSATSLTGSTTATGSDNVITTKALAGNLDPEADYMLTVEGTMDGELGNGRLILKVRAEGAV